MEIVSLSDHNEILKAFGEIKAAFPDFEKEVNLSDYLKKLSDFARVYAAVDNMETVGFCAAYMNDEIKREAYITLFGVKNERKRSGVGTQLFEKVCDEAKKAGMTSLRLEVKKSNQAARAFYEKQNMTHDGENETSYFLVKQL